MKINACQPSEWVSAPIPLLSTHLYIIAFCIHPTGAVRTQWILPVAVPNKIIGLTLILDFIDRCHSLRSLYLPPAALGSLPTG